MKSSPMTLSECLLVLLSVVEFLLVLTVLFRLDLVPFLDTNPLHNEVSFRSAVKKIYGKLSYLSLLRLAIRSVVSVFHVCSVKKCYEMI